MSRVTVMHVVDTLDAGGAERVAVNLVNALPREQYAPLLCTTRREGALATLVAGDVGRLVLARRGRFDARALMKVRRFVREQGVRIVHAHGTSIFVARVAALLTTDAKVIWHDHYGAQGYRVRPQWLYRLVTTGVSGVIAVSEELASWARGLGRPADSVWYIPNFVLLGAAAPPAADLPGSDGFRIVCVGNLRAQKNQIGLLRAMPRIIDRFPNAHLLLAGGEGERIYGGAVREEIARLSLTAHVSLIGYRPDIPAVLAACDVGVLSSASEAFPLALLEYGSMGLATVATRVGQCDELLDHGRAGLLVAPNDPDGLATAIRRLLSDATLREGLGRRFQRRVEQVYAPPVVLNRICEVYEHVLAA
jgi:glycosyltransferase involved in cell wall biosynthesis